MTDRKNIAVIGAGYWGPNLARNFRNSNDWNLAAICDLDIDRARRVAESVGGAPITTSLADVLSDPLIDAIAIATPAGTHHRIVMAALDAGKHVIVEKPLADSRAAGREMVSRAAERGLVLMADHTYCYTPAVLKIRELISEGFLGDILFVDSVRINLGLIQPDVDVFWDLAPHDLSIMDFVLPGGLDVTSVSAHGADPLQTGKACVGYLAMPLAGGAMAHVHVNWLSPTKIRQMVIGGTKRTLVWDDLNPQQRVSVYDRGVDIAEVSKATTTDARSAHISYRLGDTWAPALAEGEALAGVATEFAAAIREGRPARTDGEAGLRVLSVLEAANESLNGFGAPQQTTTRVAA
ncbi:MULTISPECIES: Gfo/Idh/MocA family protein [Microbacterium]|uniref:Gfo/Idh/MocA family oxidoreductase n=1 Tax=Microbacterium wangchenii TaxID=2541726 RepID=A0ABX5SNV0_9MICO|nr:MULTISPECIES: Gfo/Idh/MocA family oxidoreductase [Microbacterium]KAA9150367.1 Gfo/Idh/MocA family oxidoreductase [Microbacterium lushaniae]KAA9151593.1 Gfo/Idh/MocA family oxidoreductase [Microbacterium lushaniae]MCK6068078.1 Gfo/Idh/MocA family oxidoreductase [Microbacterium sp. EYE_512]QBR87796.1 Gfo/Idh/MocA family oxidoreductase [Microbacterium wangchenii]TXK16089.1 Gfo/Idh/MocA family oxidoreductase [Microbacterium wangchenii]